MKSMSVGRKITVTCLILIAASMIQAGVALYGFRTIDSDVQVMTANADPGILSASALVRDFYLLRGNNLLHILAQTPADMDKIQAENDQVLRNLQKDIADLDATSKSDEDRANVAKIKPLLAQYLDLWRPVEALDRAGKLDEATTLYLSTCRPVYVQLRDLLPRVVDGKALVQKGATEAVNATDTHTFWYLLCICIATLAAGAGVATAMIGGIERMLRRSVAELDTASSLISSASEQVAESSQSMAQGASEQAATIQETSSASTEINSMAQRNLENSRSTTALVSASQARFEQTNQSLDEMVVAMDGITASSQQISRIIKVIDEIAFQTNILALNAAVEAARAGEAGMGFAVVADEVRNLAQRSAQAAKDTATLIEESIQRSLGGKAKVDVVAESIRGVAAESAKIKMLVDEINVGSVEQSRGIDQIARSIGEMERVTQSSAATAEEGAAVAQDLNAQANSLREVVARLSRMVGAAESAVATTGQPNRALVSALSAAH